MVESTPHIDAMTEADVASVIALEGAAGMTEARLLDELHRPWSRCWVVRGSGSGVDAFLVSWHVVDELHVLDVATRPAMRRRGLGRALMNEVVGYARKHSVRHVLLEVRRSNAPAIALYRAVGFFATGVRERYYPDDEDAVEMALRLDPATGAVVPHADEVRLDR